MNKVKSLKINMIMNILLTVSSLIFPIITFPYVSRILSPEGLGRVSFSTSIVTYFSMIAQLGIPTYGIRACAKVRDNKAKLTKTVQEILIINFIMCIISYSIFFLMLYTVPQMKVEKNLFIIISISILFNSIGVEWLYKAMEEYTYITIRSVVCKIIALIAMFIFINNKSDYVIYGGISIFAACASNFLNFLNLRKYILIKKLKNYDFKNHMKMIIVFFSMSVASVIYTNLDTVMLGFFKGNEEVGYYNAAIKVKAILVSVVSSVSSVLLPRVSYYVEKGEMKKFNDIAQKTLNFVLLIAFPISLYFCIYAKYGILFISGQEYMKSILPMQILMPTIVFIGITNILGIQIMIPLGKEKQLLFSQIIGAILDIIINILLIPKYASVGASIGTLIAEICVSLSLYISIMDRENSIFKEFKLGRCIFALTLSTIFSAWIFIFSLNSFISLTISACCFFSIYFITLLLLREQIFVEVFYQLKNKFLS